VSVETVRHSAPVATPAPIVELAARLSSFVLFGVLPAALLIGFLAAAVRDDYAFDFHQFWQGGRDVLHGVSPYPTDSQLARADDSLDPHGIQGAFRFPYPAGAAVALVPFGALPFGAAAAILTVLLILATVAALRILEVRDWRCYGVVFAWVTTLGAIRLGTFTPLLVLALALVWRYRDRPAVAGPALAAAIILKVFLWPMIVWFVLTRRFAAAAWSVALAAGVTLASWAVLGFEGLSSYPELLRKLADIVATRGYSLDALAAAAGIDDGGAALRLVIAGLVLGATAVVARRPGGEAGSFALAIAAAIVATPIVWLHYFMLLLLPIALARPRLSMLWLVPLLYWATPFQETGGDLWRILLGLVVAAAIISAVVAAHVAPRPTAPAHV
jgi:alpha-1,2-mannosyltransferase